MFLNLSINTFLGIVREYFNELYKSATTGMYKFTKLIIIQM